MSCDQLKKIPLLSWEAKRDLEMFLVCAVGTGIAISIVELIRWFTKS